MTVDKYAARQWREKLRDVLNTVRDPIGGCPPDEYDDYVGKVELFVREGASDETIKQYLHWAEAEHMGFGKADLPRLDRTLVAIRQIGLSP